MIAPEALPTLWQESLLPGGRQVLTALRLLKPPPAANASGSATITVSAGTGWATGSQPRAAGTDGTWQAELAVLRAELYAVEGRLTEQNARTNESVAELRRELQEARSDLQTQVAALAASLRGIAREDARFNSAGLPVIGCAFVLAGVPEAWADRWYSAACWLSLAAAITGAAVRRFWKLRHVGHEGKARSFRSGASDALGAEVPERAGSD